MKYFFQVALLTGVTFLGFSIISYTNDGQFETYHSDGYEKWNNENDPLPAKTGAPGENNCTECHDDGTVQSAAGTIDFTFSGADYFPSTTYDITISTATGARNGFEMTILDGDDNMAGSFTAGTNSSTQTAISREYIRHSESLGVTSWTFQWTAPSSDKGPLTVYYAFNKSNNSGDEFDDVIYLGQSTIDPNFAAGLSDYEKIDKNYTAFFDAENNALNLNYKLNKEAKVQVQLIDLSGKLIFEKSLGSQNNGKHIEIVNLPVHCTPGTYIVALFQDNLVFNRKVVVR